MADKAYSISWHSKGIGAYLVLLWSELTLEAEKYSVTCVHMYVCVHVNYCLSLEARKIYWQKLNLFIFIFISLYFKWVVIQLNRISNLVAYNKFIELLLRYTYFDLHLNLCW